MKFIVIFHIGILETRHSSVTFAKNRLQEKVYSLYTLDHYRLIDFRFTKLLEHYVNHYMWHTGETPHTCTVCGKKYTRKGIHNL